MKKSIFAFVTFLLLINNNLYADIINAKDALDLTKKEYENSYITKKTACDATLSVIDKYIRSAINRQIRWTEFDYSENQNEEMTKGYYYSYFHETCPLPTLKYQLIKKGFDVRAQANKTDNHMLIIW